MANQTNGNQFRDDEIIRLRQACPGGLVRLGLDTLLLASERIGFAKGFGPIKWRSDRAEAYKAMAGKASAEFRSRYPVPLRGTVGSFIILEQLRDGKLVKNIFPKIGGRLRLAHEENDQLSITTNIIKYDENLAVVKAVTSTMKGDFPGLGMGSLVRAHSIALPVDQVSQPVRKIGPEACD